jgi:L-histidine N-alpha-methyltransferase
MMRRPRTALIHPSFRADAWRDRRIASLRDSAIDHGFHYAGVRQAELWLEVHRRHAPGAIDPDFERIYRSAAEDLAGELEGRAVHVIGLGAGGGEKEATVLEALSGRGCRLQYTPVDVSPELALLSAEEAESRVDCPVSPVVGDLSMLGNVGDWLDGTDRGAQRVFTAFGLTPNFTPSTLLGLLAAALRPEDHLLLSANLAPVGVDDDADYERACRSIIGQYDNAETRDWLRQVLIDWGIASSLSEPRFDVAAIEGVLGFVATSWWLADTQFDMDGQQYAASEGEPIRLFFSLRYTTRRLREVLGRHNLAMGQSYVTADGQEGLYRVGLVRST